MQILAEYDGNYHKEEDMHLQQRLENYLQLGDASGRRFSEFFANFARVIFPFHTEGNMTWSDTVTTCESHKKHVAQKEMCRSMDALLLKPKDDCHTHTVIAAEITSIYHTVQHSQSYMSADCGSKLASVIFPDSKIAKKCQCSCTKAASILTDVLAPASVDSCWRDLKTPVVQLQSDNDAHMPFFSGGFRCF